MVDSKEKYKFDLGVKGLKLSWPVPFLFNFADVVSSVQVKLLREIWTCIYHSCSRRFKQIPRDSICCFILLKRYENLPKKVCTKIYTWRRLFLAKRQLTRDKGARKIKEDKNKDERKRGGLGTNVLWHLSPYSHSAHLSLLSSIDGYRHNVRQTLLEAWG